MSNTGLPTTGTTITLPVQVAAVWQHISVWIVAIGLAVPTVYASLIQLSYLPGLPTNVSAWINTASAALILVAFVLNKLFGTPSITPTMAGKVLTGEEAETAGLNKSQLGRLVPVLLFLILTAPLALSLSGCGSIETALATQAASAAEQTPVPGQAKTVYGAELTFDFLVKSAQHYVDSGLATPAQKSAIHDAVVKAQSVNIAARTAAETGTNAAIAAGLAGLNAANVDFGNVLASIGVAFPN